MTTPATDSVPSGVAELTRTFDAPRALVFEAWSRPELLSRWFGPRDYPVTFCEMDFRPGGTFVVGMTGPDGVEHRASGHYDEIVPPERIVWTTGFPGGPDDQVHTVVTFEDMGNQTRIHARQAFRCLTPETAPFAAGMNEGWNQTLDNLGTYLGRRGAHDGPKFRHRLEIVSDTEACLTREFAAPARLVFEAITRPELVARWYGWSLMRMVVSEANVRPGGEFRRVLVLPDGTECAFRGRYVEVEAHHRLIFIENFLLDGQWTPDLTNEVTLVEHGGITTLTRRLRYVSKEHRDGHLGANMEIGVAESYQRLDQFLAALLPVPTGTLCWDELVTPDPAAARAFYGALLGWTFDEVPHRDRQPLIIARAGGARVASIRHLPAEFMTEGARRAWLPFVAAQDLASATARARQLGAEVLTEPHEAPGLDGTIALIQDPTGPVFALWHGPGSELTHDEPGSVCWHDVYPTDGARARAFYGELLGWEADTFEMMGMEVNTYARQPGAEPQAFSCDAGQEGYWQPFFSVIDVDGLTRQAVALGATLKVGPKNNPAGGRFAHLLDPQGAPFGLMHPTGSDPIGR